MSEQSSIRRRQNDARPREQSPVSSTGGEAKRRGEQIIRASEYSAHLREESGQQSDRISIQAIQDKLGKATHQSLEAIPADPPEHSQPHQPLGSTWETLKVKVESDPSEVDQLDADSEVDQLDSEADSDTGFRRKRAPSPLDRGTEKRQKMDNPSAAGPSRLQEAAHQDASLAADPSQSHEKKEAIDAIMEKLNHRELVSINKTLSAVKTMKTVRQETRGLYSDIYKHHQPLSAQLYAFQKNPMQYNSDNANEHYYALKDIYESKSNELSNSIKEHFKRSGLPFAQD